MACFASFCVPLAAFFFSGQNCVALQLDDSRFLALPAAPDGESRGFRGECWSEAAETAQCVDVFGTPPRSASCPSVPIHFRLGCLRSILRHLVTSTAAMATPRRSHVYDNDSDHGRQSWADGTPGILARSSSTPYDMYKARSLRAAAAGAYVTKSNGSSSPSPFVSGPRSGMPHVARQSAYTRDWEMGTPADSNSPVSRKGSVVASPGLRGVGGSALPRSSASVAERSEGSKETQRTSRQKRISRAFVRRRTIRQRSV